VSSHSSVLEKEGPTAAAQIGHEIVCLLGVCLCRAAWSEYSDWGECSTADSCGRGVKVRTRSCTNGGTPGVDRLCMGPSNQSTVCKSPSCDGL